VHLKAHFYPVISISMAEKRTAFPTAGSGIYTSNMPEGAFLTHHNLK